MKMKRQNFSVDKKKLFLYSAHELNIVSTLQALKLWNSTFVPEYTSAVIFELIEDSSDYFVKVKC